MEVEKKSQYQKQYRETHKQQIKEQKRQYYQKNKEQFKQYREAHRAQIREKWRCKTGFSYERLSESDTIDINELKSEREYIKKEMETVEASKYYKEFEQFCKNNDMKKTENIEQAYKLAKRSNLESSARGLKFEKIIKKLLLNKLDEHFKVYYQVPHGFIYDNCRNCRKIDFVITEQ